MALAARCPECNTAFRIVPDQLKISEGWVRCGHCSYVFNAFESQFEISEAALEQTLHEQQSNLKAGPSSFVQSQSFVDESTAEQTPPENEDNAQTIDLADDTFENTVFEDTILEDSDGLELADISPDLALSLEDQQAFVESRYTQTGFDVQDSLLSEFHIGWQDSFNQSPQPSHKSTKKPKTSAPAANIFHDSSLTAEMLSPEHTAWNAELNYDQLFESSWQENNDLHATGTQNEIPPSFGSPDEEVALEDPETLQPAEQQTRQAISLRKVNTPLEQDDGLEVNTSSRFTGTAFFPQTQAPSQDEQTVNDHSHSHVALSNTHGDAPNQPLTLAHYDEEYAPASLIKNESYTTNKDAENIVDSRFGNTAFSLSDFLDPSDEISTQNLQDKLISSDTSAIATHETDENKASHTSTSTLNAHSSFESESPLTSNATSKYNNTQNKHKKKKRSSKHSRASSSRYSSHVAANERTDVKVREVSFAKEKNYSAFWNKPLVKFAQWAFLFALVMIFLGQLSLTYKDTLAAQFPALRPVLDQLCEPFECTVHYPRAINDITIYDSSFRRTNSANPNRYTLMLLLKNTGTRTLEFPWVELTLVDNATGTPYSRKIFSPQDLGGIKTTYFPAGKEVQIDTQLSIQTDENTSLGFNIILFYP